MRLFERRGMPRNTFHPTENPKRYYLLAPLLKMHNAGNLQVRAASPYNDND
jgi:hypothetical protein